MKILLIRINMPINVMQSPIYQSFSMLHPDGTLMCHCNQKKAQWYIKKNLADWIDDKTFKLRFEPEGHGKSDSPYYIQKMENKCVVCGTEEELNKHHVVPYVFRSRFPIEYKESNHHDIVATCVECHENYEGYATRFKEELAQKCGVSMNGYMNESQKINKRILSARNIIKKLNDGSLINEQGDKVHIPEDRVEMLKTLSLQELLEDAPVNGAAWADKIIENVLSENKLFDFIKMWRQHFLDHTHPKNLPEHWDVEHPLEISTKAKNKIKN